MHKFDVVICTYNRQERAAGLVRQILTCDPAPQHVIIVDATDDFDPSVYTGLGEHVKAFSSSHKNQPYQRYVGFFASDNDVIVYFDDDVDILDTTIFDKMLRPFQVDEVAGVGVGIQYDNILHTFLGTGAAPSSASLKAMNILSGVPMPPPGKMGYAGVVGPMPEADSSVEYLRGPNMAFRRKHLEKAFDHRTFCYYAGGIGKGEDKMLSHSVLRYGSLHYVNELLLHHPAIETAYFKNAFEFSRKVAFSRYILTRIYAGVSNKPSWWASLRYYYFIMWRILISGLKSLKPGSQVHRQICKGYWQGAILTLSLPDKYTCQKVDWEKDARNDASA